MKKNPVTILIIAILVSLGIGFYGGTRYQSTKKTAFVNQFNRQGRNGQDNQATSGARQQFGSGQMMQGRGGMRPIAGEIINADTKSITIKQPDGSNKIVLLSTATQINKAQTAQVVDLKIGERVSVFGIANSDGSYTAQNIQLNPILPNVTPTVIK